MLDRHSQSLATEAHAARLREHYEFLTRQTHLPRSNRRRPVSHRWVASNVKRTLPRRMARWAVEFGRVILLFAMMIPFLFI